MADDRRFFFFFVYIRTSLKQMHAKVSKLRTAKIHTHNDLANLTDLALGKEVQLWTFNKT